MPRQEIIELIVKTDKAVSQVESLQSEIKDLKNEIKISTDKSTKGFEDMNKASKSLAGSIKGVGLALKAAGVKLAIDTFNTLKEVIFSSQEVTDFFNTSIETMKIGFSKFAKKFEDDSDSMFATWGTFIDGITNGVKAFKKNFTDQMTGQFDLVTGYLKKSFLEMRIAFNNFVGDTEEAASLTKDLEAATKQMSDGYIKMKGAATEATDAIKDFAIGIAESVTETIKQAEANVEMAKQAEIAAVKQQGLIEKYDIQAEQLRQIRDNEFKTIEERIQANDDLKDVLDKQEKAMLEQVNIQIRQAQTQYNLNKNQENYIALLEARNEKQAVLAQIEGFRSEQDSNANALLREKIELEQNVINGIDERKIAEAEFTASLEDDVTKRLQLERDAIDLEEKLGVERLTKQRDQYKEGTQAFVDANEELLNFQQEIHFKRLEQSKEELEEAKRVAAEKERIKQEEILKQTELEDAQYLEETRLLEGQQAYELLLLAQQYDKKREMAEGNNELMAAINEEHHLKIQEIEQRFAEEKRKAEEEAGEAERQAAIQREQLKYQAVFTSLSAISTLTNAFAGKSEKEQKRAFEINKGVSIAETLVKTYQSAQAAYLSQLSIPTPDAPIRGAVAAGIATAAGLANVAAIAAQRFQSPSKQSPSGGGGGGGAVGGTSPTQAPQFNVVGQSGFNQIATALGDQQPVQAYVVAQDVTTAQELDNNIISAATVGG